MAATKAASKATKASSKKAATKATSRKARSAATGAKKATGKKTAGKAATKKSSARVSKAAPKKAPAKAAAKAKKAPAKKAPAKAAAKAPAKTVSKATPKAGGARSWSDQTPAKKAPVKAKRKGPLDKFLQGQLTALETERATYLRQAASLKAEADLLAAEREPGDVQFDEESGEGDTLAVERERDLALSAQASAAVEEIDIAITKIHDGTYGICEQCGTSIPKERLRALPYAALCVQCKSAGFSRR